MTVRKKSKRRRVTPREAKRVAKRYVDTQIQLMQHYGTLTKKLSPQRYEKLVADAARLAVVNNPV